MKDSSKMVKQAVQTWFFTGAATSDLSQLNGWTTKLMQDFYSSSRLSTLRFGTTGGLEQAANGTSDGITVLARDSSEACLKSYLADGVTSASATYPDDCNYDPRYSTWYEASRISPTQSTFSDTYGNAWLAAVSKACAPGCTTGQSGAWAVEWQVSAVGATLASLKDGFSGELAIVDTTGIVLSTSSGVSLEPAISCTDPFIQRAAAVVVSETDYDWSEADGLSFGFEVVGSEQLVWNSYPQIDGSFVALMSFDRIQFYEKYDQTLAVALVSFVFALLVVGVLVDKVLRNVLSLPRPQEFLSDEIQKELQRMQSFAIYEGLEQRVQLRVLAVEACLKLRLAEYQALYHVQQMSDEQGIQAMIHRFADSCMQDAFENRNVEIRLRILLCSSYCWRSLLLLFETVYEPLYLVLMNAIICTLVYFEFMATHVHSSLQVALLIVVLLDGIIRAGFVVLSASPFAVEATGQPTVAVSWSKQPSMLLTILYPVLTFLALNGSDTFSGYILAVMLPLRNESMWPAVKMFVNAVLAAGSVAYLFIVLLLVTSATATVLLHGKYDSGDFYTDSQFQTYFHSVSTMFIYLAVGENFVECVEPGLGANGLFAIFFVICSLLGLFFVASLLVQIFSQAYAQGREQSPDSARYHHYVAVVALFKFKQRASGYCKHPDPASSESDSDSSTMSLLAFQQLMLEQLQCSRSDTGDNTKQLSKSSVNALSDLVDKLFGLLRKFDGDVKQTYPHEICALATVLSDMNGAAEYQMLVSSGWMPDSRDTDTPEQTAQPSNLEELDVKEGELPTSSENLNKSIDALDAPDAVKFKREKLLGIGFDAATDELKYVADMVGAGMRKLGSWTVDTSGQESAFVPTCFQARLRSHLPRLLDSLGVSSHEAQLQFVQTALGSTDRSAAQRALANLSMPLIVLHLIEAREEVVRAAIQVCSNPGYCEIRTQYTETRVSTNQTASEWQLSDMRCRLQRLVECVYCIRPDSEDPVVQCVTQLVQLVQLHKWRIQAVFNTLDADSSFDLTADEFERLWILTTMSVQLQTDPLLQDEAELMWLTNEIEQIEEEMLGLMQAPTREKVTDQLREKVQAQQHLEAHIVRELGGSFHVSEDRLALHQIVAFGNLAVAACFGAVSTTDVNMPGERVVDWMLGVFPLAFSVEFAVMARRHGFWSTVHSRLHPSQKISNWISHVIVLSALVGFLFLLIDRSHAVLGANAARFLTSTTVLLVITKNRAFEPIIMTFVRAANACVAVVTVIFTIVMVYALASKDLFGDKVLDEDSGQPFFDTASRSLTTMFRLFLGEGWHDVMYASDAATTEVARLWFVSFIFFVTMFGAELFVGVIVTLHGEVEQLSNSRLNEIFAPILGFPPIERDAVIGDLLNCNHQMVPYDTLIKEVESSAISQWCDTELLSRVRTLQPPTWTDCSTTFHEALKSKFASLLTLYGTLVPKMDVGEEWLNGPLPVAHRCSLRELDCVIPALWTTLMCRLHTPHDAPSLCNCSTMIGSWLISLVAIVCHKATADFFVATRTRCWWIPERSVLQAELLVQQSHRFSQDTVLRFGWTQMEHSVLELSTRLVEAGDDWYNTTSMTRLSKLLWKIVDMDQVYVLCELFYQHIHSNLKLSSSDHLLTRSASRLSASSAHKQITEEEQQQQAAADKGEQALFIGLEMELVMRDWSNTLKMQLDLQLQCVDPLLQRLAQGIKSSAAQSVAESTELVGQLGTKQHEAAVPTRRQGNVALEIEPGEPQTVTLPPITRPPQLQNNAANPLPLPKLSVRNLNELDDSQVEEKRDVSVDRTLHRLNANDESEVSHVMEIPGPNPNALQDEDELDVLECDMMIHRHSPPDLLQ